MNKFQKLEMPISFTLEIRPQKFSKEKWFCMVEGGEKYLHRDLTIKLSTTFGERPEGLFSDDESHITDEDIEKYYTGFFDSEEEAFEAYQKYYYLHAKEPGH